MNIPEVQISLNQEQLEFISIICIRKIDNLDRSRTDLENDSNSYSSFEKMKLDSDRSVWIETYIKVLNALEVINQLNTSYKEMDNGGEKIIHTIARADG